MKTFRKKLKIVDIQSQAIIAVDPDGKEHKIYFDIDHKKECLREWGLNKLDELTQRKEEFIGKIIEANLTMRKSSRGNIYYLLHPGTRFLEGKRKTEQQKIQGDDNHKKYFHQKTETLEEEHTEDETETKKAETEPLRKKLELTPEGEKLFLLFANRRVELKPEEPLPLSISTEEVTLPIKGRYVKQPRPLILRIVINDPDTGEKEVREVPLELADYNPTKKSFGIKVLYSNEGDIFIIGQKTGKTYLEVPMRKTETPAEELEEVEKQSEEPEKESADDAPRLLDLTEATASTEEKQETEEDEYFDDDADQYEDEEPEEETVKRMEEEIQAKDDAQRIEQKTKKEEAVEESPVENEEVETKEEVKSPSVSTEVAEKDEYEKIAKEMNGAAMKTSPLPKEDIKEVVAEITKEAVETAVKSAVEVAMVEMSKVFAEQLADVVTSVVEAQEKVGTGRGYETGLIKLAESLKTLGEGIASVLNKPIKVQNVVEPSMVAGRFETLDFILKHAYNLTQLQLEAIHTLTELGNLSPAKTLKLTAKLYEANMKKVNKMIAPYVSQGKLLIQNFEQKEVIREIEDTRITPEDLKTEGIEPGKGV